MSTDKGPDLRFYNLIHLLAVRVKIVKPDPVFFSPDSQHIVSAMRETLGEPGADMGARVWDVATGQQRFAIPHDASLVKVVFSPNGLGVLTVSPDKSARFWYRADLLRSGFALLEAARATALPRQALTAAERRRFFLDDD